MAFLLRTVSQSAQGREIVRTARVEGDILSIGRDPACDVRLTDLAVGLRHARIARDGGRLEITCEPGLTVELDGRKLASGAIGIAAGGDIRIASHLLRFAPAPPDSDEIAVSIEQAGESAPRMTRDRERLFTLAPVMPGKRTLAWLLGLLALLIGLAWPIQAFYDRQQAHSHGAGFQADQLWSSGPLSRAHAGLAHDCGACHAKPFESVRDKACLACHAEVHAHADPFRLASARPELGRWGRIQLAVKAVFNLPPGRCIDCHVEHRGARAMAATPQHFCADCHVGLKGRLPDSGLGDAGDFGRVHPEFAPTLIAGWSGEHPLVRRSSLAFHPREQSGLKFPHALHLAAAGSVAQMARTLTGRYGAALGCADCHRPNADGVRFEPVEMERDCGACHSLAFDRVGGTIRTLRHDDPAQVVAELREYYRFRTAPRPPSLAPASRRLPGAAATVIERTQFVRGAGLPGADQAIRAVFSPGGACYDCHRIEMPPPGSLAYKVAPVAFPDRYLRHGWFDHRAHAAQSCASCHAASRSQSSADLLIPGIATCRLCHGGEQTSKPVASTCAMCHDYHLGRGAPAMLIRRKFGGRRIAPAAAERPS
jgi:hypothetical protein